MPWNAAPLFAGPSPNGLVDPCAHLFFILILTNDIPFGCVLLFVCFCFHDAMFTYTSMSGKMSITTGDKAFYYMTRDSLCFLTLAEARYPKRLAFLYLDEVGDIVLAELVREFGNSVRSLFYNLSTVWFHEGVLPFLLLFWHVILPNWIGLHCYSCVYCHCCLTYPSMYPPSPLSNYLPSGAKR